MKLPRLLVKVKSCVGVFELVDGQHLCQVLVQAYYSMTNHAMDKISICLCDQKQFHFFGVKIVTKEELSAITPLLEVKWVQSAIGSLNIVDSIAKSLDWPEEED